MKLWIVLGIQDGTLVVIHVDVDIVVGDVDLDGVDTDVAV